VAVPTATMQTFQQIGRREDLTNAIYDISPTEKPFTSAIRKTAAKQSKHDWQTDSLASASATNAHIEGDDSTAQTADPTVRLNNQLQTIKKTVSVSGRAREISTAGRSDEFEYQLKKRMAEVGRDLEAALTQNNAATAGAAASAPLMASAESWLGTNRTSLGTGTAQTTPGIDATVGTPITAPTDSTVAGTLVEAALKAMIRLCWDAGGDPSLIMVGSAVKQKISGSFTGIATRFRDVKSKSEAEIISGADVYVSDFGSTTIVANRFQRARTVLVIDPEYWALASLRGFKMERLAKTGDSDKAHIVGDYTLECRNEKASAKIADVDGAL
jgi:hypothetical protein